MSRAFDLVTIEAATREIVVVMCADIADSEELTVDVTDGDWIIANEDLTHRAGCDFFSTSDRDKTRHESKSLHRSL